MARNPSARRRIWRYIALLILVATLFGGWSWLWSYASGKAEITLDGWRAREAKAGRIYACGSQTIGGYPRLGALTPLALARLAQCLPGEKVRLAPVVQETAHRQHVDFLQRFSEG